MKRFIGIAAILISVAAIVAGCSQPSATPTTAPAVQPTIVATATTAAPASPAPTSAPTAAPALKATSTALPPTPAPTTAPTRAAVPTLTPTASARFPLTLTDDSGRTVKLEKQPQRIISLAPSNTEILFALDLGSKVVGVTDFCDYPAAAQSIAKIGGVKANLERIVSLTPDLVLSISGNAETVKRLDELKIPVLVLDPKDIGAIFRDLEMVGSATGAGARATQLVTSMQARMDAVSMRVQGAALPKVFYELDATDPAKPYTAGPGSWHDQLITMAGGSNVAASAKSAWVQFSLEELLKADPEIIILGDAMFGTTIDSAKKRTGWSGLTAVKKNALYPIDDNLISRPGPRLADGLEALAKIIHPEIFK